MEKMTVEREIEQLTNSNSPVFVQYSNFYEVRRTCEQLHGVRTGTLRYLNPGLFENDEFLKSYMFSGGLDGLLNFQDCIDGTLVIENTHLISLETQKVLRTFLDVIERKKFKIRTIFLSLYSLDWHKEAGLVDFPFYYRIKENVLEIN